MEVGSDEPLSINQATYSEIREEDRNDVLRDHYA